MNKNFTFFALLILLFSTAVKAQTQFWSDTFEDSGAPSSGTRTPSYDKGGPSIPYSYYFLRTDGSNIALQDFSTPETTNSYQGKEGLKFWAGEDLDRVGTGTNNPDDKIQTITWTGINITGKTGLTFKGLFAANSGHEWQDILLFPVSYDFLEVEYRINGGTWTLAGGIYPETSPSGGLQQKRLRLDTNGDKIGDGAYLTRTFQEIAWDITGTGTTLDLRFRVSADAAGTQEFAIDNFRLFEAPPCTAPTITTNPVTRNICTGANTTFTAAVTGATAYKWQVDTGSGTFTDVTNSAPYSGATTVTLTITNVPASYSGYRYRLVAINGGAACFTNSNSATLNVSNMVLTGSQINNACRFGSEGSATVSVSGGIAPYTQSWSPSGGSGTTASNLTAGLYVVTVTDASLCSVTKEFIITQPATNISGTTTVTNIACRGGNTGAINLTPTGGVEPYTYNWGGGIITEDRNNLTAGTYSVTITDANGCSGTISGITVTQPAAALSGTAFAANVACFGGNTGEINLTPTGGTGPYTFSWSDGATTEDRSGLTAGIYSVTITDSNGCETTVNGITVSQPASVVSGTAVVTNVSCNGGSNGSINLTPTGGVGPYVYNWGGGITTTKDRSNLTAGTYSVTITDVNGCSRTISGITVTQPAAAISGATVVTNVSCFGDNTGEINLIPSGGTGPYTFSWNDGATTEDRNGLTAGTYSVTITDNNGCQTTLNGITVSAPASVVSGTAVVTNVSCFGGDTGEINLIPNGGTGPYTFSWNDGATTEDRSGLTAGIYSVTITDNNGCETTVNGITVSQPASVVSGTAVVTNVSCFGGNTGEINLIPNGGTGPYTFSWNDGATTEDRNGLTAGTYSVTIADQNGCEAILSITVSQPTAALDLTSGGGKTDVSCFGGSNGTATVAPTGGTSGYTYSWAPSGGTAATATGLAAGTYTVTVTDALGCQDIRSFTIDEPSAPLDNTTLLTGDTISANQSGATYQWYSCPNTILTGETGQSFTATAVGSYKVVIINGACEVTSDCVTISSLSNPDFAQKSKFIMFPNPSKGIVNIECDYDGELTIINQLGQTVKKVRASSDQLNTINIENLADGTYFISEIRGNKIITHKLILRK
jgi:hypothetical protein